MAFEFFILNSKFEIRNSKFFSLMTGSLFDDAALPPSLPADAPLAERLRPKTLDEIVGLEDLLGEGRFLRNAIGSDRIPSMILWGPPGSGKTTLARIIAGTTKSRFVPFSATTSSIKDIKVLMEEARKLRIGRAIKTIVFIDEIHRFNKAQQDAFLPYVEPATSSSSARRPRTRRSK